MIPESTLDEILNRISIVDVVDEYVPLKKSGANFTGICPFHKEKTPSFHVNPSKNYYKCFGCNKGGNAFNFLSAIEGLPFPEAVRKLAARAGVEIQAEKKAAPKKQISQKEERSFEALELAAKYYAHQLNNGKEFAYAREYLVQRGLSQKTIEKFQVGVSGGQWNQLKDFLMKRGFTMPELVEARLVRESENGTRDVFRKRIMFPIRNIQGLVIGFGGRIYDEENQAKYINSQEGITFNKREQLYGLFENQRDIRTSGEALIVEGYMDVIGLYDKGVRNAVATMGTALTESHARTIKSFCQRVITVFDADVAGQEASRRTTDIFLNAGIIAKDLHLPDGKDPDEYVLKNGPESFFQLCEKAPRQITKLLRDIAVRGALSEQEKSKILDQMTPVLIAMRRQPDRATFLDNLHFVLNISVETLMKLSEPKKIPGAVETKQAAPARSPTRPPQKMPSGPKIHPLDLQLLALAVAYPQELRKYRVLDWESSVRDPAIRSQLSKLADPSVDADQLIQSWLRTEQDPEMQSALSGALAQQERPFDKHMKESFEAVMGQLVAGKTEANIVSLTKQIKLAEQLGDEAEQMRLLQELTRLRSHPKSANI